MLVALLLVVQQARAIDIEPILTETDAVAGIPLVMPVRVGASGQPRSTVKLVFSDGQEVSGTLAAVRFRPRDNRSGWIPSGPAWEVLLPAEAARVRDEVAWFVLADLPRGAVGQEIWLDGKPVRLRWLPRPTILGMRFGFDPARQGGPIEDPWSSPVPEAWRARPDLLGALESVSADPIRGWRARLATAGLHPQPEANAGIAITPDLLDTAVLEAATAPEPIPAKLERTLRAQTEARWRVGLAWLWAADAALSLRVRQALCGVGIFGVDADERVVVPVWTADESQSSSLLAMLLDAESSAGERAQRAAEWLSALPDAGAWVVDDGVQSAENPIPPTLGAMLFAAGDAGAIPMGASSITRPIAMMSRESVTLRPGGGLVNGSRAVYRIRGQNRSVILRGGIKDLVPPGLRTGEFLPELTMEGIVHGAGWGPASEPGTSASALISVDDLRAGGTSRVRMVIRLPGAARKRGTEKLAVTGNPVAGWSVRLWVGPFGRGRAVVIVEDSGRAEIQALPAAQGRAVPLPETEFGTDGEDLLIEILLPTGCEESNGLVHLGIEAVDPTGGRTSWPRPMLPWGVEPGRRVINPAAWLGGLGG